MAVTSGMKLQIKRSSDQGQKTRAHRKVGKPFLEKSTFVMSGPFLESPETFSGLAIHNFLCILRRERF